MLLPVKDYNPTRNRAIITLLIIIINCIVFFYQAYFSDQRLEYYIANYSMVPAEITSLKNTEVSIGIDGFTGESVNYTGREISPLLSLFTSMFMHGSLLHLLGNMLFLWIFGNNIEDYLGKLWFLFFYLLSGLGASFAHILFNLHSTIPTIGASGAVSGVMGAYLVLYPTARIRTLVFLIFIFFIDIPASLYIIIWLVMQFLYAGSGNSGIAWLAHVGGFVVGILILKLLQRTPRPRPPHIEIIQ